MQEDRIYYKELTCYEKAEEKEKLRSIDGYFDLTKLSTDQMRAEMKRYIIERGAKVSYQTIMHDKSYYSYLSDFLKQVNLHNVNQC